MDHTQKNNSFGIAPFGSDFGSILGVIDEEIEIKNNLVKPM
jgi:hypothetical protein